MSFPNIPNITPAITLTRDEAFNLLLSSIALEELGLAHILNAEGEKIQFVLGTLPGVTTPFIPTLSDLLLVNTSVQATMQSAIQKEMLLQFKLESILQQLTSTTTTTTSTPSTPPGPTE